MERSTDRILTTHAGSLTRPDDLRELLIARDSGRPYDLAVFAARVRGAVADVVARQAAVGLDIINDGEESKRNFTTYARERLGGVEERELAADARVLAQIYGRDAQEFPEYFTGRGNMAGREAVCKAPLSYIGHAAVETDILNFKAALSGLSVTETFLPAVAPGTIEHWLGNDHYASAETYLAAVADAMKVEYDAIVRAGFLLQIDDPDLADAWQIHRTMTLAEYRKFAALRVEALNHALRDIPPERVRFHVCWGSYHGPHKHDLPLRDLVDLILAVRAQAYSIEASNPRHEHEWRVWENVKLPEGITVLFVTHDQIEALSLSNRIAVMHRGRAEQIGSPRSLYEEPGSAFVRDFLGQTVILSGTVDRAGSSTVAVALEGSLAGRTLTGRGAPGATLSVGARAHVAVRPEDIEVASPERPAAQGHTLDGVVEALLFVGDRYEARVALSDEQRILLFLARGGEWREGQRLRLHFPPDAVSVWPA